MANLNFLPCPACGCTDIKVFYDHPDTVGHDGGYYLSHAFWNTYPKPWNCKRDFPKDYYGSEEDAVSAWNDSVKADIDKMATQQ